MKHLGDVAFGDVLTVSRYELSNGLSVLCLPDPTAPIVAYHTWYRVGSRYETPGKTGLAHFFEHMMFNETEQLPMGEFDRRMEEAGADTNAATWIDWTYYHESLPAEELGTAIELEAERMGRLVVRKAQVESEREVVANERKMAVDDDVQGAADERLHTMIFGESHPHGWPTIGWMGDIEAYRVADCRAFYKRWYAPNNATVVVAGAFDTADAIARIEQAYGRLRRSELGPPPVVPAVRLTRERRATMRWPTPTHKLAIAWLAPAYATFEHAVAEVVYELWLGGRSGRLRRRLVEELELVSELRGGVGGLTHEGLFDLWVSLRDKREPARVLEVIEEEIARLADGDVSDEELDKVKSRGELFALSHIETSGGKAYQIGYGETVCGDPSHLFVRMDELRRVSAADVRRFARERLGASRRAIVRVEPGGVE
ncbi:MAG: M16 family metallopeptidase [Sandaracinaceae bacterium]